MFYYFWKKFFLKKFISLQNKILNLESETSLLSDNQIRTKFNYWRERVQSEKEEEREKSLDGCLVPIFALVREVIRRQTGLLLFPTQILGGITLHYANIAQMNTGEGKTLTAFLPICLNALLGRSVFVITVNEYLAQRDWKLAKPILDFFQITSGVNLRDHPAEEKKNLYHNCTVIYTTSSELGFDYLRNNLVTDIQEKRKQDYYYAIIDEVDSILIDEAQNPLIISRSSPRAGNIHRVEYQQTTKLANSLIEKQDYIFKSKEKELWLTKKGIKKSEEFFQINNLFSFANQRYNFLLHNALKVKHIYRRDVDYVVDEARQRIVLVDELTGRLVPNRVYGAGIQQAIESKENVPINSQSKTIATITYQNFFRLFSKLSGMTGTAESEKEEFRQVYGMEVVVIPPYRKLIREDFNDLVFWDKKSKYRAIVKLIQKNNRTKKRPILIGSPSVEISEHLSSLLKKENINHAKLNAVNHQQEAEIIAQAGQIGVITISTNMAGRGTDIILSEESKKVGGLLVIGVERNTSRRIDNQLRGRSGRQGDPGQSRFYVSLEDELIKSLQEDLGKYFSQKYLDELFHRPLSGKIFDLLFSEPQEKLRNFHSTLRQRTLSYDLLINQQRKVIYNYRQKLLTNTDLSQIVFSKKKADLVNEQKEYPRSLLVKEVDKFWSDYLEGLSRVRELIKIKKWLPQDPQEGFFWETASLFKKGIRKLNHSLQNKISFANQSNYSRGERKVDIPE